MGSALWTSIKELFLLHKSDNSSPSVTREKNLSESCGCEVVMQLPSEMENSVEPFELCLPAAQVWCF